MDNEQCRELINLYGSKELLWNCKMPNYHNKSLRENSWKEISAQMGLPISELKKKMTTLLASYRREKSRIAKSYVIGSGKNVYVSKWFGFDNFNFMKNKNTPKVETDMMSQASQIQESNELGHQTDLENDGNDTNSATTTEEVGFSNTNVSVVKLPKGNYKIPEESVGKKQKKIQNKEVPMLAEACKILAETSTLTDPFHSFGQNIANELRKYDTQTLAFVKQSINNVIFEADMGHFTQNYEISQNNGQVSNHLSTMPSACEPAISFPETTPINAPAIHTSDEQSSNIKQEPLDDLESEGIDIKEEPLFVEPLTTIKVEPNMTKMNLEPQFPQKDTENVNQSHRQIDLKTIAGHLCPKNDSVNKSRELNMSSHDHTFPEMKLEVPGIMDSEVQAKDLYIENSDLVKIKQEKKDNFLMKECNLPTDKNEANFINEPCSSQQFQHCIKKNGRVKRKRKCLCPVCQKDVDTSEDDIKLVPNEQIMKNLNHLGEVVPQYSEEVFFEHFRLSREIVNDLSQMFESSRFYNRQPGQYGNISAIHQVLIFLWYIGQQTASFRDVADRFDVTISTVNRIIRRLTLFLSDLSPEIILWPNESEKRTSEEHFRTNGFPNIIGAIDGCHIKIDKPENDSDLYVNKKGYYSIQMQIVCDHKQKILDVFIGYPGSVHAGKIFRNSDLGKNLEEKCGRYFLLGDSDYPLQCNLLTPYKDRGYLTNRQKNYNMKLEKNRYIVEQCFGILKQKFRQMFYVKLRDVRLIIHFIRAACVLHNIALNDNFIVNNELNQIQHSMDIQICNYSENSEDDEENMKALIVRDSVANTLQL